MNGSKKTKPTNRNLKRPLDNEDDLQKNCLALDLVQAVAYAHRFDVAACEGN